VEEEQAMTLGVTLGLANATNARDLGGLITADGRRIRTGRLFRANALNRLTEADIEAVAALGLACVIDLRAEREVEMVGPDRLPFPPPGQLVALPLSDPDNQVFAAVTALAKGALTEASAPLDPDVLASEMLRAYRWLATSEPARAAFRRALRLMADPRSLPLLFHCTAGKDRTGWLAAVVLSALGVDRAVIAADYLRTTELSQPGIAFMIGRLERNGVANGSAVLPMLEARPEYLAEAFAAVEQEYGHMGAYLRDGLGADDTVIAGLRANLLE
jgi:protein-tyrosine phosphatase